MGSRKYWPLWHLTISRMRVFYREPVAVFWVYGFPLVMSLSLGTAFREGGQEQVRVDIVTSSAASGDSRSSESGGQLAPRALLEIRDKLAANSIFQVHTLPAEDWRKRLQSGKTDLVIEVRSGEPAFQFWDEPHRT